MTTVILAEKPSQAKNYADVFSQVTKKNGYYEVADHELPPAIITYGHGHLVALYEPEKYTADWKKWALDQLPVFPDQYRFQVAKGSAKQFNIVKGLLDQADQIIIATDSDREGENIARSIINLSGNSHKPTKRLWVNSNEVDELRQGFKNLKDGAAFYSTYKEAETRQIADWLVGINLSRLYTLHMQRHGIGGVFSIGRVQTPTLNLIYQRNQEISHFVSKPFFELYGDFYPEQGPYQGKYAERFDTLPDLEAFLAQHHIDPLSKANLARVQDIKVEKKTQYAPRLFSLSDLQAAANKRYKYSAAQTLSIAQSLYEKKVLSYPRTDTNYIGTPEFNYLTANLDRYLNLVNETIPSPQTAANKRYVNGAKVQEHYAIIPTKTLPDLSKLSPDERHIYLRVLYRTIAMFETPYLYEETTIMTTINEVPFKTTGKVEISQGWKQLFPPANDKEEPSILPKVSVGDTFDAGVVSKEGQTQPPKYYTQGTIITAMKHIGRQADDQADQEVFRQTDGIGTEATRANIIETLKKQDYITVEKNNLLVTAKGQTLCEVIKDDEIADANMTAQWERYLKKIHDETGTQEAFLGSIKRFIAYTIDKVPASFAKSQVQAHAQAVEQDKVIGTCPNCGQAIIDKGKFYGCTGYQAGCKFSLPKTWSQKKIPIKNIRELLAKQATGEIKGFKSKKGHSFNAKLKLADNKLVFDFGD